MAETYILGKVSLGYYTSMDAKNKVNSNSTVPKGTYYVYNRANGMVNITRLAGAMGWWINPTQSPSQAPVATNTGKGNGSTSVQVGSGDSFTNETSGVNATTVYQKNAHYVRQVKDDSMSFYIINMISGTTMEFDVTPESLSDSNTATFDSENVRGRSNQIYGYSSSGPRSISFELHLYDDYCYYGIKNTVQFLKGLTYPSYAQGMVTAPKVMVKYGSELSVYGLVSNVGVTWSGPKREGIQIEATVSISMNQVSNEVFSVSQIESGADFGR